MPLDRLVENDYWMAFYHPKPDYPLHILIVPKQHLPSLMDVPQENSALFMALFEIVRELIVQFDLNENRYRLITNGGENQRVPQWHWHLISDHIGESHA